MYLQTTEQVQSCVPAHDDRDFEFAVKFDIPIVQVIAKDGIEIEKYDRGLQRQNNNDQFRGGMAWSLLCSKRGAAYYRKRESATLP